MKIEIPMELVELEDNSYHLIVPVQIGSIEGDFIIDTGASVTVVDRHTPFSHEPLEGVTEVNSGSVGGQIEEVEMANIPQMAVGGHALRDVHAAVIDLDYVNSLYDKHLRRRVAGLLGCDFLVRYGAIIDYENRRLTLKVSDEISHY